MVKIFHISIASVIVLLLLIITSCSSDNNNSSDEISLDILTINLLFSELSERTSRLESIADFIEQRQSSNDTVDIIFLQEVVGGFISGTSNSSVDLVNMLSARGLDYHIYYRLSNGLPVLLQQGNAILSRFEISSTAYTALPAASEEINTEFQLTLRQEIIMAEIRVPGFGEVNLYNTHFCAFCDPAERLVQTSAAINFIESIESQSGSVPVIFGGDLNIDLNVQDDQPSYDVIINNSFVDSYTFINRCIICCSPAFGYSGCTYAVPGNIYATSLFQGQPIDISRIDYIFTKNATVVSSSVVFNDYPWVSDHSGVLTHIKLNKN